MNYKLLDATYRTRWNHVKDALSRYTKGRREKLKKVLHVGCGEGDYDSLIASYSSHVLSCDINPDEIRYCKQLNRGLDVVYAVEDVQRLTYTSHSFDGLVCLEVLEHVPDAKKAMKEISRVMKKGGKAIISVPNHRFPFTYDIINSILRLFGTKLSIGAYAFGHTELIKEEEFEDLMKQNKLRIVSKDYHCHHIIGFLQMYWVGFLQKIFKSNSMNLTESRKSVKRKTTLRPSSREPWFVWVTDLIIFLDNLFFFWSKRSTVLFYEVVKQ